MIKALAVGLGLVLGVGVVHAQTKRTPKRKAPATAPKPADPQPAATPAAPTADVPPASPAAPAATPTAAPTPPAAPGSKPVKPAPMKTDEKAAANEALARHAAYKTVAKADEECALAAFHAGIDLYNNGLFLQSVQRYREALKCWDHPGIHYNLALALINLDQPVGVYEQLNESIRYGAEPLTN
ncbi:MAG TPA: hypothetical protein VK607_23855, partial [Kofleriaceae bacterium]|nr:hypothetical protein [Kofleriaceae bacterium]